MIHKRCYVWFRGVGRTPTWPVCPGTESSKLPTMPWFRSSLASDGLPLIPGADLILGNKRFIETAKRVFESEVVLPRAVTLNVNMPQGPGGTHLDTASFRGDFPSSSWLLAVMGSSGLFDRWAIRVPAALSWFYSGDDGGYEYWGKGPDQPPALVDGPFGNIALVGDNDYMFHRVRGFGDPERYGDVALYGQTSSVAFDGEAWVISDEGTVRTRYAPADVRISLLWRAVAFRDNDAARSYNEHLDDLDTETLVRVFLDDLSDRGISCQRPADHLQDPAWVEILNATYGLGGFEPNTP